MKETITTKLNIEKTWGYGYGKKFIIPKGSELWVKRLEDNNEVFYLKTIPKKLANNKDFILWVNTYGVKVYPEEL